MTNAERQKAWRTNNPENYRAARRRYYLKNRRAIIYIQRIKNAGLKPPPIAEVRALLS